MAGFQEENGQIATLLDGEAPIVTDMVLLAIAQNGFDAYNFAGEYRFYESAVHEKQVAERSYPCRRGEGLNDPL